MNSPWSSAYLRFLQRAQTLSSNHDVPLSANQKALLEAIALAWFDHAPLTVRQAIGIEYLGSPATLHKRLAALRTKGYVEDMLVDSDRRTKLLAPSEKALAYFDQLGGALTAPDG